MPRHLSDLFHNRSQSLLTPISLSSTPTSTSAHPPSSKTLFLSQLHPKYPTFRAISFLVSHSPLSILPGMPTARHDLLRPHHCRHPIHKRETNCHQKLRRNRADPNHAAVMQVRSEWQERGGACGPAGVPPRPRRLFHHSGSREGYTLALISVFSS